MTDLSNLSDEELQAIIDSGGDLSKLDEGTLNKLVQDHSAPQTPQEVDNSLRGRAVNAGFGIGAGLMSGGLPGAAIGGTLGALQDPNDSAGWKGSSAASMAIDAGLKMLPGPAKFAGPPAAHYLRNILLGGVRGGTETAAGLAATKLSGKNLDQDTALGTLQTGMVLPMLTGTGAYASHRILQNSPTLNTQKLRDFLSSVTGKTRKEIEEVDISPAATKMTDLARQGAPGVRAAEQLEALEPKVIAAQTAAGRITPKATASRVYKAARDKFSAHQQRVQAEREALWNAQGETTRQLQEKSAELASREAAGGKIKDPTLTGLRKEIDELKLAQKEQADALKRLNAPNLEGQALKKAEQAAHIDYKREAATYRRHSELLEARKIEKAELQKIVDQATDDIGIPIESLAPEHRQFLKDAAKTAPSEMSATLLSRGPERIEFVERLLGKNSQEMQTLRAGAARQILTEATRPGAPSLRQFNEHLDKMGKDTINKMFGNPDAYDNLRGISIALQKGEQSTKLRRSFVNLLPTTGGLLAVTYGTTMGRHPGIAAAGAALGAGSFALLNWGWITELLAKSGPFAKAMKALADNPRAGAGGSMLSRAVTGYIMSGATPVQPQDLKKTVELDRDVLSYGEK